MNIREDEGMALMDAKTQLKVDIIVKVSAGKISIKNASKLLKKSRRTIERYLQRYRKSGVLFFIHKSTKRTPVNKSDPQIKSRTQYLIRNKYFDFNLAHLREELEKHESIFLKRETLRKWAHEIHHVKREKKRRSKIRKKRDRMESPGLLLQMDGSHHNWFGNQKSCLIGLIDDADSEFYGEFFESETTMGCMKVLKELILKKGIFKTLYVDRAGIFGGPKRCNFSQVQRACEELGIQIIYANSAEGKGRIERSFDTLQDRLVPELRINGVKTMEDANKYLNEKFIPNYWNKNVLVAPLTGESEYRRVNYHMIDQVDSAMQIKNYRKVKRDHTFSFLCREYRIAGQLKFSLTNFKIEIRESLEGKKSFYFSDKKLSVQPMQSPSRPNVIEIEALRRIRVAKLSRELNSVSAASRNSGISRQAIYRDRAIIEGKGRDFFLKTFKKGTCCKNPSKLKTEEIVVNFSLDNPQLGEGPTSIHLKKKYKIEISRGTVRNIWLRNNIETIALRVLKKRNSFKKAA